MGIEPHCAELLGETVNQQAISKLSALLLGMMLFNPACLAAQTNTAPSAQPLSEALEPAENSAQTHRQRLQQLPASPTVREL
ncbi:MAG: hypothetical protein CM15mP68_4870 [Pseudomonadota bacterium]|nr:MAG: hypothetical protein CM15mP68_4870 [Pseudomonadota bacterium]